MSAPSVPEQFSGYAAFEAQGDVFNLKLHKYTPQPFTDEDVDIKIEASGVCGSDLHTLREGWENTLSLPAVVGHEIIGTVVRAGKNSGHTVGSRVGVGAQVNSCRTKCENCKSELENYCPKLVWTYQSPVPHAKEFYTQGGYANYFRGSGHFAIRIPDEIPSDLAAPLLCAGVTVFEPLKVYGAGPGKRVGVIGIGGLGHLALQFSKALGAETYALTHSSNKEADCLKLGAIEAIQTKDQAAVLEKYTGFFDLIICTSFQADMPLQNFYLPLLKAYGTFNAVGLPESLLPAFHPKALFAKSFAASLIGSPSRIAEMLEVAVKHNVRPWIERRSIKDASQTLTDMHEGKARFRYVFMSTDADFE